MALIPFMRQRRRIGAPGAPPVLDPGMLGYNDPGQAVNDDALYIGSTGPGAAGAVTAVTVTNGGTGYTAATATVTTSTGAGAALSVVVTGGAVSQINVDSQGSAYAAGDTVTITGDGSGAAATPVIGTGAGAPLVRTLVSSTRQVEIAGAQTITGTKTIAVGNLKITGGEANDLLVTDGSGNLSWSNAPEGGLLTVTHDDTLDGDGTSADPLSVLKLATARNVTLQAAPAAGDGSQTVISATPASFDGSADAIITNVTVSIDGGTY